MCISCVFILSLVTYKRKKEKREIKEKNSIVLFLLSKVIVTTPASFIRPFPARYCCRFCHCSVPFRPLSFGSLFITSAVVVVMHVCPHTFCPFALFTFPFCISSHVSVILSWLVTVPSLTYRAVIQFPVCCLGYCIEGLDDKHNSEKVRNGYPINGSRDRVYHI